MTKALRFGVGLLALPAPAALAATGSVPCGASASAYPAFCDIPRTPTDVRSPRAFKTAVVDLRRSGVNLVRATAPDTFGLPLGDADAFSQRARAEAAPPVATSNGLAEDTEAFAAELRRRASPPPRTPR